MSGIIVNPYNFSVPGAVDMIWVTTGADTTLITTATLLADTIGSTAGWTYGYTQNNPSKHTRASATTFTRLDPIRLAGNAYTGAGYNICRFNLTEALTQSAPYYEGHVLTAPAGLALGMSMTGISKWNLTPGSGDVTYDTHIINCTDYAVLQTGNTISPAGTTIRVEGRVSGVTQRGRFITIPSLSTVYTWHLRANRATQRAEMCLVDNSTGIVIGASECGTGVGDIASIQRQDYLLSTLGGGGALDHGILGVNYTTAVYPLTVVTIPTPTSVLALQTASGQITIRWSGVVQRYRIERSSNGGSSYSTIASYDTGQANLEAYDDTGLSNATTYIYRVVALVGSLESVVSSTSSVTTDNSIFITVNTAVFNGSTGYGQTAGGLTNVADSKTFTLSFWYKPTTGGDATAQNILQTSIASRRFQVVRTATNNFINVFGRNPVTSGSLTILDLTSTVAVTANAWHHIYITADLSTAGGTELYKMYIDGVAAGVTKSTFTNDFIDLVAAAPTWQLGRNSGGDLVNGSLAELWFSDGYLDTPNAFVRRSATGTCKPITIVPAGDLYLSLNGSGATTGVANGWAVDSSGNANNFTVFGTWTTDTPP